MIRHKITERFFFLKPGWDKPKLKIDTTNYPLVYVIKPPYTGVDYCLCDFGEHDNVEKLVEYL